MYILTQAGLPDGVCNVVTGTGRDVGEPLCAHKKVRHITFTGSVATGSRVMQNAARHIASVTLELGGKSPAIVLADCDLDNAVADMLEARSEEHTSELQSLMRISYAVFCLKKKNIQIN